MPHERFGVLFAALALGLFLGMVLVMEVGRRLGVRQAERRGSASRVGVGTVDAAVFAVFSLIMGFMFSGAASRFDHRRELIVREAGAVNSAWKRIDLLGTELQPPVRDSFRRYLDALLEAYAATPRSQEEVRARADAATAQQELWGRTVEAALTPAGEPARVLIVPALTDMFHAVETERLAQQMHPPVLVWVMLGVSALAAALFAGYAIASGSMRNWLHVVGVAATISIVVFVILELESPRLGLLRVDTMDRAIAEVRATMD